MLWGLPSRVRVSSPGVYLLFALSSLQERLSGSLRLPPLPLHGYPCGLLPLIPLLRFPHATPVCNGPKNHNRGHWYG